MANFNVGPIASSYNASGDPVATVSNINIAGTVWNLYTGSNGANAVYSFLPASGSNIMSFSADLNLFLKVMRVSLPTYLCFSDCF
jgi:xyloglucan-specific endo-beta-1,4-glucanase